MPSIVSGIIRDSVVPVYPVMDAFPLVLTEYRKPSGVSAPHTSKTKAEGNKAIRTIRDTDAKHIFFHIRIS